MSNIKLNSSDIINHSEINKFYEKSSINQLVNIDIITNFINNVEILNPINSFLAKKIPKEIGRIEDINEINDIKYGKFIIKTLSKKNKIIVLLI